MHFSLENLCFGRALYSLTLHKICFRKEPCQLENITHSHFIWLKTTAGLDSVHVLNSYPLLEPSHPYPQVLTGQHYSLVLPQEPFHRPAQGCSSATTLTVWGLLLSLHFVIKFLRCPDIAVQLLKRNGELSRESALGWSLYLSTLRLVIFPPTFPANVPIHPLPRCKQFCYMHTAGTHKSSGVVPAEWVNPQRAIPNKCLSGRQGRSLCNTCH